jgi:RNAse (barnase) inhibitor barstar
MSKFVCLECGKEFDSKRSFHAHLKAHALTIGDYYVKNYDKRDLYTNEKLAFRSYDQYMRDNFNNHSNFISWMGSAPAEIVKNYIKQRTIEKFKLKEIKVSPPNLFYDLSEMANIFYYKKFWGSYSNFLKELEVEHYFNKNLPPKFWDECHQDIPMFTDTREKAPLTFKDSLTNKLDFGDYTARGDLYTKTFVDRKAQDDFRQTFGKDIDRFRREMDRCVEFNSYMFVVAETSIDKLEEHNKTSKFKSNLSYLWHNVRNLIIDYPKNLQIVFAHNRAGAKKLIPLILYHGTDLWSVDLQYFIDKRINGLEKRKTGISA